MAFKNNILTASLTKFGTGTKLRTGHCPEEHQQVTLLQTEEWNPQVMSGVHHTIASTDAQSLTLPQTPKPQMQRKTEYVGQAM
jgi:hypothetical protein